MDTRKPLIAITCNVEDREARLRRTYIDAVTAAGGVPVLVAPPSTPLDDRAIRAFAADILSRVDGVVFSGGDDLATEKYGQPKHPASELVSQDRQRFEEALYAALDEHPTVPVLGICMGMQLMALHNGGVLNQHLPDTTPTHAEHVKDHHHTVKPTSADARLNLPASGAQVASQHHQSVTNPGKLRVTALAHDGVIEVIDDPSRPFYVGVQWHPERTANKSGGLEVFQQFVQACNTSRGQLSQKS